MLIALLVVFLGASLKSSKIVPPIPNEVVVCRMKSVPVVLLAVPSVLQVDDPLVFSE